VGIFDRVGIGAFAFAGVDLGLGLPAMPVLAMVTATGGGVVRDLMAAQVPLVLRTEVLATEAAAGALVVWSVERTDLGVVALAGAVVTAGSRVLSLVLDIHLPVPGRAPGEGE
jgi:uncharacterized membrane protein YeiH